MRTVQWDRFRDIEGVTPLPAPSRLAVYDPAARVCSRFWLEFLNTDLAIQPDTLRTQTSAMTGITLMRLSFGTGAERTSRDMFASLASYAPGRTNRMYACPAAE